MKKLPTEFIQQLKEKNRLEAVLGEDGHILHQSGSGYKLLSPFHKESDPSFHVDADGQYWSDFSIGERDGGDVIAYVMKRDSCSFIKAMMWLCKRAGIKPPDMDAKEYAEYERLATEQCEVEEHLTAFAEECHKTMPLDIRELIRSHYGLNDKTINDAKLGWVDSSIHHIWQNKLKLSEEQALRTGLFYPVQGYHLVLNEGTASEQTIYTDLKCSFHERILFPYFVRGKVVYFAARVRPDIVSQPNIPKYKKLSRHHPEKHPYISETISNEHFYFENSIRTGKDALITEGLTDVLSALQSGFEHVVSPVTTRFRQADADKLSQLCRNAKRVIIINDNEENKSGEKGALATAKILHENGVKVLLGELPRPTGVNKVDVNSFVRDKGKQAFRDVVKAAKPYVKFLLDSLPSPIPPHEIYEKLHPILESIVHCNRLEQEAWKQEISRSTYLGKRALNEQMKLVATEVKAAQRKASSDSKESGVEISIPYIELHNRHMADIEYDAVEALLSINSQQIQRYMDNAAAEADNKNKCHGSASLDTDAEKDRKDVKRKRKTDSKRITYHPQCGRQLYRADKNRRRRRSSYRTLHNR